jgi:hypothetical protein
MGPSRARRPTLHHRSLNTIITIEENDGAVQSTCRGLRENSNADAAADRNREAFVSASRSGAAQFFLLTRAPQSVTYELSIVVIAATRQ